MMSKSLTPSPLSSINDALFSPFPPLSKLSLAGVGGLNAWEAELRKHVPSQLCEHCDHFLLKIPMPMPIKPNEHDTIRRFSAPLLVQPNPSSTPIKSTNSKSNLTEDIQSASSEEEESTTPIPNLLDQTPPFPTSTQSPQTASPPTFRDVFKYPHDHEHFLTTQGYTLFDKDMDKYEAKLDSLNKGAIAFFSWIIKHTIGDTAMAMFEANDRWDKITSSKDSILLRELIDLIIKPTGALRSLASLQNLLDNHQNETSHPDWAKNSKRLMEAVKTDFAHPIHPDALCPLKLFTAAILMTTANKEYVKYQLTEGKSDVSKMHPHVLLDNLQQSKNNLQTYASRVTSKKSSVPTDKTPSKSKNPATASNGAHVLATTSLLPKPDPSLMTKENPHSRPRGKVRPDSVNDGDYCTHCWKNGWKFQHLSSECHDVKNYNEKFPSQSSTSQSNLQNQSSIVASLLNLTGDNHIRFKPNNQLSALQEVTEELGTSADFGSEEK